MTVAQSLRGLQTRLKDLVLAALYRSGLTWLIAKWRLQNRIVVLTYHRVLPIDRQRDSYSSAGILVTPENFDRHMRLLRRHFRPLTADEFVRALDAGAPLPARACLVTFDDGWHDTLEFALPILLRHQVPAVLFVPTDHVGRSHGFWQERMARLLHRGRDDPQTLTLLATHAGETSVSASALADRDSVLALVARIKQRPLSDIEALLATLEPADGTAPASGEDRFVDWRELGQVAASGVVSIGSHAVSHRPLTKIPLAEARGELARSIEVLRERIGVAPILHAYPNGDANDAVAAAAAEAGFAAAFVAVRGHVAADSDRHRLRRLNMHESATRTPGAFLARLLGLT